MQRASTEATMGLKNSSPVADVLSLSLAENDKTPNRATVDCLLSVLLRHQETCFAECSGGACRFRETKPAWVYIPDLLPRDDVCEGRVHDCTRPREWPPNKTKQIIDGAQRQASSLAGLISTTTNNGRLAIDRRDGDDAAVGAVTRHRDETPSVEPA